MFYCDPCADTRHWPQSGFKSYGRCECCNKTAVCNDTPSKFLPDPSDDDIVDEV